MVGPEYGDALGGAPRSGNALDRAADKLSAIGHEHDLVSVFDREGSDKAAITLIYRHCNDAFSAAPGCTIFIGRGSLSKPPFRHCQDVLLGDADLRIARRRQVGDVPPSIVSASSKAMFSLTAFSASPISPLSTEARFLPPPGAWRSPA